MEVYKKLWRYSINDGEHGGIVYSDTKQEAEGKIISAYNEWNFNVETLIIWKLINDDYFDNKYKDVFECY